MPEAAQRLSENRPWTVTGLGSAFAAGREVARHGRRRWALFFRRAPITRPRRAPIGKSATAGALALRCMGGCLPDLAGWSGYPSIAAMPSNPGIDVICQKLPTEITLSVLFQECCAEHDGIEQSKTSGNQNLNLR